MSFTTEVGYHSGIDSLLGFTWVVPFVFGSRGSATSPRISRRSYDASRAYFYKSSVFRRHHMVRSCYVAGDDVETRRKLCFRGHER